MRTEVHYSGLVSLTKMHGAMKNLPAPVILSLFLILVSCRKEIPCVNCPPENGPDTTSHNFTWTVDMLGDGSGGALYDVAIINDTLAYAVGEIYLKDSTGQYDPLPYNAVLWNGREWSLKRIRTFLFTSYIVPPLEGISAFSPNDIWCVGSFPVHGDGSNWKMYHLQSMGIAASVSKGWGVSSNDMYFVGPRRSIVHYDGSTWQKIESGITDPSFTFTDIWGIPGSNGSPAFVLTIGSNLQYETNPHIISLTSNSARDTLGWIMKGIPYSAWFSSPSNFYIAGAGVWQYEQSWKKIDSASLVLRIRGTSNNNIVAFGVGNTASFLVHYNGSTWKEYPEVRIPWGFARGLAVRNNMVMAVGFANYVPFVIRGIRQ
jgi:hypothetical protein